MVSETLNSAGASTHLSGLILFALSLVHPLALQIAPGLRLVATLHDDRDARARCARSNGSWERWRRWCKRQQRQREGVTGQEGDTLSVRRTSVYSIERARLSQHHPPFPASRLKRHRWSSGLRRTASAGHKDRALAPLL